MKSGSDWLMAQQANDGGWHSATYGALRQGAAVTSLVLYSAAHWPAAEREAHRAGLEKGWKFLEPGARKLGCVAQADGSLDYPEYATAMVLWALPRLKFAGGPLTSALRKYLLAAQLGPARGFEPASVHFGGWDLLGNGAAPGQTSGSNVSLTSFALAALADHDSADATSARTQALTWLARCQNVPGDGGFFFAPERESEANKAQWTDKPHQQPRSYGTATADGLCALAACGVKSEAPSFAAAVQWLAPRDDLRHVPGFADAPAELGWREGLLYYYFARVAGCFTWFPAASRKARCAGLLARLQELQKPEGYWRNESSRMREDDPLIATSLALVAQGACTAAERGGP